jgi:hypothetical protein
MHPAVTSLRETARPGLSTVPPRAKTLESQQFPELVDEAKLFKKNRNKNLIVHK